jgi:hypothetical protein
VLSLNLVYINYVVEVGVFKRGVWDTSMDFEKLTRINFSGTLLSQTIISVQ